MGPFPQAEPWDSPRGSPHGCCPGQMLVNLIKALQGSAGVEALGCPQAILPPFCFGDPRSLCNMACWVRAWSLAQILAFASS